MSHSPDALPSFIFPDLSLSQLSLKNPPKLGFMASGSGTNFAAIAESIQNNELNAKIEVLYKKELKAINDIIKGILTVTMEGLPGHEYHLGYNNPVSILEIVKMFDTEYIFIEEKKGERISSIVKDNKIELGWKANLNIEDYIKFSRKIK